MPEISSIYDSYAIQPDVQIGQNIGIYITGAYQYHRVNYIEGLPAGPAATIDMVAQTGNTQIGANATLAKSICPMLQMYTLELAKIRIEPLDNVELRVWELSGQAKFMARQLQSRIDRNSRWYDNYMAMTTFWIYGFNYDMNLEVINPLGYAQPTARAIVWGWRYLLDTEINLEAKAAAHAAKLNAKPAAIVAALKAGDPDMVKAVFGPVTFIPAQGKQA